MFYIFETLIEKAVLNLPDKGNSLKSKLVVSLGFYVDDVS